MPDRRRRTMLDASHIAQWLAIASAVVTLLTQAAQLAEHVLRLLGGR